MFRERRHSHKASFWLGSGWVSSMQLFKMLAWSTVNPSKHTTRLKRTLFGKSHQFRALTKKEEKRAAVLNFSCFKISLKRKKKLTWQRPYILGSIATSGQLCFILERWRKPAGARAGKPHGHWTYSARTSWPQDLGTRVPRRPYNCAVLENRSRGCGNSSSLLKSESTLATLKSGLELGLGGGVR